MIQKVLQTKNALTNATLSRMTALGMGMSITLYRCDIDTPV
jgi:hypothetical protein